MTEKNKIHRVLKMSRKKVGNVGKILGLTPNIALTVSGMIIDPSYGASIGGLMGTTISQIFSNKEIKYIEKRLQLLENYLGNNLNIFVEEINSLDEHEHFAIKKLVKHYLFEAVPESIDIIAKSIIKYILNKNTRPVNEKIIDTILKMSVTDLRVLQEIKAKIHTDFDDKYSDFKWEDFCKHKYFVKDKEMTFQISSMISSTNPEIMFEGLAYKNLKNLGIINTSFVTRVGMNTELDIDEFSFTSLGKLIMDFIDIEYI